MNPLARNESFSVPAIIFHTRILTRSNPDGTLGGARKDRAANLSIYDHPRTHHYPAKPLTCAKTPTFLQHQKSVLNLNEPV